jgi:hypothetical protein
MSTYNGPGGIVTLNEGNNRDIQQNIRSRFAFRQNVAPSNQISQLIYWASEDEVFTASPRFGAEQFT